jgi:hypothetical protein
MIDRDALTVAMSVAPGAYARNRMFSLHKHPEVQRARARAAIVRGLVRQLSGALGTVEGLVVERSHAGGRALLQYRIANLHLERRVELTDVEAACVMYLAGRVGAAGLRPSAEDRALLQVALRRMTAGLFGHSALNVPELGEAADAEGVPDPGDVG